MLESKVMKLGKCGQIRKEQEGTPLIESTRTEANPKNIHFSIYYAVLLEYADQTILLREVALN